jgi:hypothetical protein
MIQGREDYFKDRDNEEEKFAANLDKPKNWVKHFGIKFDEYIKLYLLNW